MCGIAGFVFIKQIKVNSSKLINQMIQNLHSRGPDEKGIFIWKNFVMGIARLNIIDLVTGSQPIYNENRTIAIVLNGEIYNYKELRKELEKKHKFYTNTDTEVLVHLYEEYKENMLSRLNGMFAFALFDKKEKKLFIARDRIGIKPLYFYNGSNIFAFASELKGFLPLWKQKLMKKQLSYTALVNYLIMEYVPAPYSIYENIYKLLPGHYLVFKNNRVKIHKYWDLLPGNENYSDFNKVKEHFYNLLQESVKIRLRSDVPLGVFLSGGIDSSTITYLAQTNLDSLSTFSIRFNEPSFDEGKYINLLTRDLKIKHYSQTFSLASMRRIIPEVINYMDEPFADASILPTYMLSKFAHRKIVVALGGDGGDEIFAGYPTYQAFFLAKYYNFLPTPLKKLIKLIGNKLPVSLKNFSFDFKVKKFLSAVEFPYIKRNFLWLGAFQIHEIKYLLTSEILNKIKNYNPLDEIKIPYEIQSLPPLTQILYIDLKYYLQNDILVKVDRASMANSLEVRVPFLDHKIVEYVFGMPLKYKINLLRTKWILKTTMKQYLPSNIIYRPKKGFGIPVAKWIKNEMQKDIIDLMKRENIEEMGIFNYKYILQLLDEHLSGKKDNRKKLWTLISFIFWYNKYGKI